MIKRLLTLIILSFSLGSFAQFTLKINDEEAIDGQIFTFNTLFNPNSPELGGEMKFVLTSVNATEDIQVACTPISFTNNDNSIDIQFCWGLCYDPFHVGQQYPPSPVTLVPESSTAESGNHFENHYVGDNPDEPIVYVLKFHEVDDSGDETGTPITVTYIYDADYVSSVEDHNQVSYQLYPTVTQDFFTLQVHENISVYIINTQGQLVQRQNLAAGNHTIDVSNLSKQLYYVVIQNQQGKRLLSKLLKN